MVNIPLNMRKKRDALMHILILNLLILNIQPPGAEGSKTFVDMVTRERSLFACGVSLSTYLNAKMQMRD